MLGVFVRKMRGRVGQTGAGFFYSGLSSVWDRKGEEWKRKTSSKHAEASRRSGKRITSISGNTGY